ncbi:receptor protein kinase-like protein ZAR1 [Zingiber officinale]|nr:receptor protein kinase-like protein ZAR1 [Zingiber officinale]XP_042448103.1 receptor protein kinase-like protein ZAR1 [Zingiber officinale]
MAEIVLLPFLASIVFFHFPVSGLTTDGLALLALKAAVSADPSAALSSWSEFDANPCGWAGVACSRRGRVAGIVLPDRALNGYLPSELSLLSALRKLELPGNRLSGPIPAALGHLHALVELDLSNNNLSGPIPPQLGRLASLARLDLSSNRLAGHLPPAIAGLPHLSGVLNLSFNLLSGSIPQAFGSILASVSLDLSQNNLSGEIPRMGSLVSQGPTAFAGNPGLCGFPLKNPCPAPKEDAKIPKPNPSLSLNTSGAPAPRGAARSERRGTTLGTVPILTGIVVVAILSIAFLQWHFCCRSAVADSKMTRKSGAIDDTCLDGSEERRRSGREAEVYAVVEEGFGLELEELLRASAYVVGKSRSGIVYKVVVERDGSAVAVRRLGLAEGATGNEWRRRRRTFETEAAAIGRAKHPNVVRLLAYYYAPDEHLLVYDYIPNGTLHDALHGGPKNPMAPAALSWATRLAILRGTARGLAYLHEMSSQRHAHGGIASSKILLDDDHRPYISGYGVARLLVPKKKAAVGEAAQKADVYAFGLVVLEAVTGRTAGAEVEAWVRAAFLEERPLSEVVDPALLQEVEAKQEVLAVFHVALACTARDPDLRPRIRAVADSLDRVGVNAGGGGGESDSVSHPV